MRPRQVQPTPDPSEAMAGIVETRRKAENTRTKPPKTMKLILAALDLPMISGASNPTKVATRGKAA